MNIFNRKRPAKQNLNRSNEIEKTFRTFAAMPGEELFTRLSAAQTGLTGTEAMNRLADSGKNVITVGVKNTPLHRLKEAVINPFNLILMLIAVVTFITDVVLSKQPDYVTVAILVSLILISSMVAFIQSQRSNSAAENLSKLISNKADVWRDGELISILMEEIVPGDVVRLSAGDMIPADVRFLSTKDTFVGQAALTGESNPVEKFSSIPENQDEALTDISNLGFTGSNVISGSATALVLLTGNNTYIGSMAKSLSGDRAKTSFERGVDSVSQLLIRMMLVMVPIVFLVNGLTKQDWPNAFLFAVTVAVGMTPEMLPVILTSTLAHGAVTMSKHKVIVRTLSAIQTFGEMDILCTDKTGTLTEDKIVLEKYIDVQGNDDMRILELAYLNSSFQTGRKNLIDLAIINRGAKKGMESVLKDFTCIDEIPFDFSRRRMSVVLSDENGKTQLITKGAVEEIIEICSSIEIHGQTVDLDEESRQIALSTYNQYNSDGLRMVAIARKDEVPGSDVFSTADEKDMILIGFVGFLDPPKESAASAITALREHGVRTVVLTGDSEGVAAKVCSKVGVDPSRLIVGSDLEKMDDAALHEAVKYCDLFAKMSPAQKERVVSAFQEVGHTVGFMGDGINDAQALRQADVGISVDSAVDIAKETADIILMEKDLMVLEEGVIEGRKTFGNIIKYIKMSASGNFGNMISVLAASIFLPFLPMLPVQFLTQNLLCDFSQMGIPFDTLDEEYIRKPRKWDTHTIKSFMVCMGPLSSLFDLLCFAVLWWKIGANRPELAPLFQCGWFVFGTLSQVLVIHMIRTGKVPFIQSRPSLPLLISTLTVGIVAVIVGFSDLAIGIDMHPLPFAYIPWLILILGSYFLSTQLVKHMYIKKFGDWL